MADQNRNPGSKQADGDNVSSKSKPTDKEEMGAAGGRTGSGVGSSGKTGGTSRSGRTGSSSDALDGSSSGTGTSGGGSGYSVGNRKIDEETDEGDDMSGESGSGKSDSTSR